MSTLVHRRHILRLYWTSSTDSTSRSLPSPSAVHTLPQSNSSPHPSHHPTSIVASFCLENLWQEHSHEPISWWSARCDVAFETVSNCGFQARSCNFCYCLFLLLVWGWFLVPKIDYHLIIDDCKWSESDTKRRMSRAGECCSESLRRCIMWALCASLSFPLKSQNLNGMCVCVYI